MSSPQRRSARGKVDIGALIHPNAQVEKVTASWDLDGVTPDMKKLTGEAKFGVAGGKLNAIKRHGRAVARSEDSHFPDPHLPEAQHRRGLQQYHRPQDRRRLRLQGRRDDLAAVRDGLECRTGLSRRHDRPAR